MSTKKPIKIIKDLGKKINGFIGGNTIAYPNNANDTSVNKSYKSFLIQASDWNSYSGVYTYTKTFSITEWDPADMPDVKINDVQIYDVNTDTMYYQTSGKYLEGLTISILQRDASENGPIQCTVISDTNHEMEITIEAIIYGTPTSWIPL